jgi:DNA-directed RNA polymerase specialized sigma24 family protein
MQSLPGGSSRVEYHPESELNKFNQNFCELYRKRDPHAISVFAGLERRRQQYNLSHDSDIYCVLNGVYISGVKYIEKGGVIRNFHAFVRWFGMRTIQELSRTNRREYDRTQTLSLSMIENLSSPASSENPLLSDAELTSNIDKLFASLHELSDRDRQILYMRFWSHKSWDEIALTLSPDALTDRKVATIRQAGHRAIKRLRKLIQG